MKVADILRLLRDDGWFPVFFLNPDSGSKGLAMRYAVVIEKAGSNYSAYVPDLPGCVATGATIPDAESSIRHAIECHIEGMREDGTPIPVPTSKVEYVEVAA